MEFEVLAPLKTAIEARFSEMENEGYTRDAEGFYICPKCNTRASKTTEAFGHIPEACECKKAAEREQEEVKRLKAIEMRRLQCFPEKEMCFHTFDTDNGTNPEMSNKLKNYVENFETFKKDGIGLLLYGTTGSGKTFFASCVANALIDNGYSVKQTDFIRLSSKMSQTYDTQSVIDTYMRNNHVLVFDDLGVQRNTPYMKELIYSVINTLYNANLPFIITTNLTAEELKNPTDPDDERVYQRIIERCHALKVENPTGSQRIRKLAERYEKTKAILDGAM